MTYSNLVDATGLEYFFDLIYLKYLQFIGTSVQQEAGKGLSSNDYTTTEKNKLSGIASGAQVNVIETVKVNGSALTITDKAVDITVPTNYLTASDITDMATKTWVGQQNYLTSHQSLSGYATETWVNSKLNDILGVNADAVSSLIAVLSDSDTQTGILNMIAGKADSSSLATVATSGSYNDLTNKPTLFSGSYDDLTNKPTIPSAYTLPIASSSVLGGVKIGTGLSINSETGVLSATVQDISGKANTADLSTVAFSGSYNDLLNKPTLADALVQADWNQTTTTAKDYIKNKPENLVHSGTASGSANQASFDANADTVHNKAQVLSSTQQGQARKNINAANIDEAVICIESNSAPTTSTLAYTDSFGTSRNYKVGDQIKVYDSTDGEYKIYTLYNINNGTATWEQGGGGVATNTYSVLIDSNQTDKTDIASAMVTYGGVMYASGATITVPHSISITVSDLSVTTITGYSVDVQVSGWNIIVTYSTEILTVTITADEIPANVSSCTVTVKDSNSTTLGTLSNGQSLKIPYGINYVCTPSAAPHGYTTPSTITKDWENTTSKSLTFTYLADFIDFDIPSGLMWAKGNIVKDSNGNYAIGEETDLGTYVSWGNIVGHNEGEGYDFSNYQSTPGYSVNADIASNDATHDIALATLGSPWHLPTKVDFQELYDNTDTEWTTINGVAGRKFMKKTDHSIYVFFPASGYYNGTSLSNRGSNGFYWSSSWYSSTDAYGLYFNSSSVDPQSSYYRRYGFSVRAVQ